MSLCVSQRVLPAPSFTSFSCLLRSKKTQCLVCLQWQQLEGYRVRVAMPWLADSSWRVTVCVAPCRGCYFLLSSPHVAVSQTLLLLFLDADPSE